MIRKHVYGVSPTVEMTVGGVPFDYTRVNGLEISLTENQHDMATLQITGLPTRGVTEYINAEAQVTVSTGGNYSQTVTGYIADVRPISNTASGTVEGSPFQASDVVILGASYIMRGKRNRVWQGETLLDIATDMCDRYGFSLDCPASSRPHNMVVQSDESDWEFLVRYAKSLGMSVTLHGTHMHIFDPYQAVSRGTSFNRLVTRRRTQNNAAPAPGQINTFRGSFSEDHPDGKYKDTVVVVSNGDTPYEVTTRELQGEAGTSPARFTHTVNEYVDNYEEAERAIDQERKAHYDYKVRTSVMGVAGCLPGGVVEVDNYDSGFDGLWYVHSVRHEVSSYKFWTELDIVRNRSSQLVPSSVAALAPVPSPQFVNGRWVASRLVRRAY